MSRSAPGCLFLRLPMLPSTSISHQKIESFNYDYNTGAELSAYSKSKITPVAAFVAKLNSSVSLYANYIEGLVQGDTAPNTYLDPTTNQTRAVVNAGEIFAPYATRQEEVGVKYDGGTSTRATRNRCPPGGGSTSVRGCQCL